MAHATNRTTANSLPSIAHLFRDPVLRSAFASPGGEPPLAPAPVDRRPVRRPNGGATPAARILELA